MLSCVNMLGFFSSGMVRTTQTIGSVPNAAISKRRKDHHTNETELQEHPVNLPIKSVLVGGGDRCAIR